MHDARSSRSSSKERSDVRNGQGLVDKWTHEQTALSLTNLSQRVLMICIAPNNTEDPAIDKCSLPTHPKPPSSHLDELTKQCKN